MSRILILFLFFSSNLISQVDINNGLLLHYSFDNTFEDASFNNNDGQNDGVNFIDDRNMVNNNAANFIGESKVDLPDNPALKPDFPFAYAFWYNPIEPSNTSLTNYGILTTDHSIDRYAGAWCTLNLSNNKMGIAYGDGGFTTTSQDRRTAFTEHVFNFNTWHHVVANYLNPEEVEVFVNGCQIGSYLRWRRRLSYWIF